MATLSALREENEELREQNSSLSLVISKMAEKAGKTTRVWEFPHFPESNSTKSFVTFSSDDRKDLQSKGVDSLQKQGQNFAGQRSPSKIQIAQETVAFYCVCVIFMQRYVYEEDCYDWIHKTPRFVVLTNDNDILNTKYFQISCALTKSLGPHVLFHFQFKYIWMFSEALAFSKFLFLDGWLK